MKKIVIVIMGLLIFHNSIVGFAAENMTGWQYSKEINYNAQNKYKAFFLDEEIYSHAQKDLADIRIINEQNEFVPYYIYNAYLSSENERNIEYVSKHITSFMKKHDQYSDFEMIPQENNVDILGNILALEIDQKNFLRQVDVYGGYDNEKWQFIKTDNIYRTDTVEKLSVNLDQVYKYTYYRIVFKDEVNLLPIKNLKLVFNNQEVVYDNYKKAKKADFKIEQKDGDNRTILLLNNDSHLKINRLKIMSDDHFKRKYDLYYKNNADKDYTQLTSGEICQLKLQNFKVEKTGIMFNRDSKPYLVADAIKLIIYNKDNKPINIKDIEISYYVDKIIFEDDGSSKYKVLFDNKDAQNPSYDIESYKNYIEKEQQEICVLSNLVQREVEKEGYHINYHLVLNIMVVLISIFLIVLIVKKSGFKDL